MQNKEDFGPQTELVARLSGYGPLFQDHSMAEAGRKLKRVRERLNLRYRDVEEASNRIAEKYGNSEYVIALSRLADIENKGTLPTIYRLYSLCAIYRLDFAEALEWYGVNLSDLPADSIVVAIDRSHLVGFSADGRGEIQVPLALDPGTDLSRTTYLSRIIQRWGRLPLMLLNGLDLKNHRYAFIGTEDWTMYPLLQPGSLVLIDETHRKIISEGWSNEFERPIYFLEHRNGYSCGWCHLNDNQLIIQPHPASMCHPEVYSYPADVDVIGQVSGVAMRLDRGRTPRTRS
jgi:transcriptional regulator with XRE-family HTH domain